jgi:hypothetical protein
MALLIGIRGDPQNNRKILALFLGSSPPPVAPYNRHGGRDLEKETVMERIEDHIEDALIDLGAVSVETKGEVLGAPEAGIGRPPTGLSED